MVNNIGLQLTGLLGLFFGFLLSMQGYYGFGNFLIFFQEVKHNTFWNISYSFGLDTLSIVFCILTVFLIFVCLLSYKYVYYRKNWYVFFMLISLIIFLELFITNDLLVYFFFYELSALPMYLMISIWGSRERKIYAGNLLVMYTMLGSLCLLFTLFLLYIYVGTLNYHTFYYFMYDERLAKFIFLLFFFSFAIKIPIVPLHLWLPEAHVEAITPGSVLLAGLILKLSVYIYLRGLMHFGDYYLSIILISFLTYYMPALFALVQNDVKKIIAYASISHMGFLLFGLFSLNEIGFYGAVFMLFGHAIVASALFLKIGMLYERYKTRNIYYYGGLVMVMPLWCVFFFIFVLGNIGFPGTVNFAPELMIFYGGFVYSKVFVFLAFIGMLLPLVYSLWLYIKITNGALNVNFIKYFTDITRREFFYIIFFFVFTILLGLYPNLLLMFLLN